ncbi:hypothetical protein ACXZ65_33860 [Streptomyces aculeolatus]
MRQEQSRGRSSYAHPRRRPRPPGRRTSQEEIRRTDEGRGTVWINTISAGISAFIAIPALILALLAYADTKHQEEEGDTKEAAQFSWAIISGSREASEQQLELENRSLRPIYDTTIEQKETHPGAPPFVTLAQTVQPCTRVTLKISTSTAQYLTRKGFLIFRDSLNNWWRTGYGGGLSRIDRPNWAVSRYQRWVTDTPRVPLVATQREELSNCG